MFGLHKLYSKQSLLRFLWKKVHRLEKSTPKPLVALQTNISYVVLLVYGDMCYCEEERRGTVSGASKVGGLYKKSNIMYKNGTKNQKFQEIRKLIRRNIDVVFIQQWTTVGNNMSWCINALRVKSGI